MDVQNEQQSAPVPLSQLPHVVHHRVDFREHEVYRPLVLPVEVSAGHARPGVAQNDAVWVEHRHNLEEDFAAQLLSLRGVSNQVLDEAVDDVAASCFARVHSPDYGNNPRLSPLLLLSSSNGHQGYLDSTQRMAKLPNVHKFLLDLS